MQFILIATFWIVLLFCIGVLLEWLHYRLSLSYWWRPHFWRARYLSWRYGRHVRGWTLRRESGPVPSLGRLRVTKSRAQEFGNGPPEA